MTTTDETKRRAADAKVTFAGAGASALADPSFVAKADVTNRVMLLIGKAYRVTCPMPFALVGKSSDEIEESWERDDAALWLRWPVSISSGSEEESSTDSHGLARIAVGEELSTDYTDYHGLEREVEARGGGGEWTEEVEVEARGGEWTNSLFVSQQATNGSLSDLSSPQASTSTFSTVISTPLHLNTAKQTPRLLSSSTSRLLAHTAHSGPCGATFGRRIASGSLPAKVPSETLCVSSAHALSDSNLSLASFTLLSAFQTFQTSAKPSKLSKPSKPSQPFTMHVSPAGIGGSFAWTNVCCRVSGSGYSFAITCDSECACGGCAATGYLEYEGYRLPACGGFCGCGGSEYNPGEDEDPDEDPPLPGASATFSKSVVFFEDEYENAPGETVPWQSTETTLSCWAYGGTRGGHVRIEIAGADGLVQYGGLPLPFEQDLGPDEEVEFENVYRAVSPSGGEGDVVVTATFTENETDWTETTVDRATAVKVLVQPKVYAPENDKEFRHKFGIGESVYCKYQPTASTVKVIKTGGGSLKKTDAEGVYEYDCPLHAETDGFAISGDGCRYVPRTSVVVPRAVLAQDAGFRVVSGMSPGLAGGVLLTLDLYVLPLDASFSGVKIEEVPDVGGSNSGYFSDAFFMSEWFHGKGQGAGNWLEVYGNNKFLSDEAGFKKALPQLDASGFVSTVGTNGWASGSLIWEVPCGWAAFGVEEGDDPVGIFANDARQVMTIDAQGNVEVQKYGNTVRREIDGRIILNGERER